MSEHADSATPAWYCVRTKTKQEHIAAARLRALPDVTSYCPRIKYRKATRRGPVWFVEALFPGYVFARFRADTSLKTVSYAMGVIGVVRFGLRYPTVSAETIEALRAQMSDAEPRVFEEPLRPGDRAEVIGGPFQGLDAVITRVLPAKDRVRILLNFLGRTTEAEVSVESLSRRCGHPMGRPGRPPDAAP